MLCFFLVEISNFPSSFLSSSSGKCVLVEVFFLFSALMVLALECRMFHSGSCYYIVTELLAS